MFAEQPILDTVAEEMCSDQETVEEVSKSDSEEPAQKEYTTGKVFINNNIVDNYRSSFRQIKNINVNLLNLYKQFLYCSLSSRHWK